MEIDNTNIGISHKIFLLKVFGALIPKVESLFFYGS